jgi:hypothetical protein
MFEEYLRDADSFFTKAEEAAKNGTEDNARSYYRASVFCAFSAIEAYVNYIGDSFAKAGTLPPHEIAFLNDKVIYFSTDKGAATEKPEFHKLDDKLRVLMRRFDPGFDFKSPSWSGLMDFKKFRDSLVHPRQVEDETPLADYRLKIRKGLGGIIGVMNSVSKGIYKKPLRRQLLDLIPN